MVLLRRRRRPLPCTQLPRPLWIGRRDSSPPLSGP